MKSYYHLPGLFEFYELYKRFLPLFFEHRDYFYDWCEIGSIYGAPDDCIWGGGRCGYGENGPEEVCDLMKKYHLSARLTFSNSLLEEKHLGDKRCNQLCELFEEDDNGIIITSDLLMNYIHEHYPKYYFVSSTTKVITDEKQLREEIKNDHFKYVVPDFRFNKDFCFLGSVEEKNKIELLCNEYCNIRCSQRKACYKNVSERCLGYECKEHVCPYSDEEGYCFSKAMKHPAFISIQDIQDVYMPLGIDQFKIEGRGLGSALILEFLLYYMVKPEYQLLVREAIYLNNMLDLF